MPLTQDEIKHAAAEAAAPFKQGDTVTVSGQSTEVRQVVFGPEDGRVRALVTVYGEERLVEASDVSKA